MTDKKTEAARSLPPLRRLSLMRIAKLLFLLLPAVPWAMAEEPPKLPRNAEGADLFLSPDRSDPGAPVTNNKAVLPPSPVPLPFLGAGVPKRSDDPGISHGDGRIQWQTWGEDAFEKALRADKPIFLFVTANWCHAGKTMERISFTDLVVATRINEAFIPIRLDRDERPDIDLRMQEALHTLTGSRGWPVIMCLTPDGRVWYGGNSMPLDDDVVNSRPGMRTFIQYVLRAWWTDPAAVRTYAKTIDEALNRTPPPLSATELPADLLERTAHIIQASLDAKAGGMAGGSLVLSAQNGTVRESPKFPAPRALDLCLTHYARSGDPKSLSTVVKTLDAMLSGGIYDHLSGGFHRYSRDRWWRVPCFEKLLVLNAEMLPVCLHAYTATHDPRYKQAVDETLRFWMEAQDSQTLAMPGSGTRFFPGSQAADATFSDDGDYFTWTVKEFENVLRDDTDCRIARLYFGVEESGEMSRTAPERNVLFEALPLQAVAQQVGLSASETGQRLEHARQLLLAARNKRAAPAFDRNIYMDGNALMAAAFIECGLALEQKLYVERGVQTLKALLKDGIAKDPVHTDRFAAVHALPNSSGLAIAPGLAQDEAALAYACSFAFEATHDPLFLQEAENSLRRLYQNHWDAADGGYFDRSSGARPGHEPLGKGDWKVKVWQETWEPSTNALAALACIRLGKATSRIEFTDRAKAIVNAFGAGLEKAGPYAAALALAADAVQQNAKK